MVLVAGESFLEPAGAGPDFDDADTLSLLFTPAGSAHLAAASVTVPPIALAVICSLVKRRSVVAQ
jgi:hypothetical protein